ncbi:MAG: DegV family protein [Eubacteriales bacterium]|nr:DegV family protein [Eubacteriales bacterium]
MGYVIVTDSVLDIEVDFLLQNGICTVPHSFMLEDYDTVEDDFGKTIPFAEIYRQLREGKAVATIQPSVASFTSVFEGILKSNRDVVYIGLSSGLSGCFQSAFFAREALREKYPAHTVYCIDTLAVSGGQTLLVREAVKRKAEGYTAEQLVEWAEEFRGHIAQWCTVEDVSCLTRNGHIQKSSAMSPLRGNNLIFYIDGAGSLQQDRRVRGRRKSLELLCRQLNAHVQETEQYPVLISHADCQEDATYLAQYIMEHSKVKQVEYHMLNPVIGAHAGPGAIGVFFYGDQRSS